MYLRSRLIIVALTFICYIRQSLFSSENFKNMAKVLQESAIKSQPGKRRISFIFLPVLGISLGIFAYFLSLQESNTQNSLKISAAGNADVTPTPMPYQEMTIPYLRSREYVSTLGGQEFSHNGSNYTAYLSSYDSDGLRVNGLLTIPTGDRPVDGWPAIVFVHGYIPPSEYTTLGKYVDYVDYLARSGFVVFKIDLRGHGDSEGEPGGAYYSSDYVVDTLNARAALQSSDFVDSDSIGLWGHSMAGNVVMRSMAAQPDIAAGVIWGGAVYTYQDMREYGIQDSSYRRPQAPSATQRRNSRQSISEIHGDPEDNGLFWQQMAPTNFLTDLKGAVALHHAVNDDVVSVEYSRGLKNRLEAASVPHELHEYPTGGHNIDGASFSQAMQRTVEFYGKYLR